MSLREMEAPHLELTISENTLVDGAKEILRILRPKWNLNTAVDYKVFTDGITNKLLGCFNQENQNDVILIRVYGNKTDMLIDRKAETRNIKLLHEVGLAPQLYATFLNGLVYEYAPGHVLTVETCRLPETYFLVAQRMADMHCVGNSSGENEPALWKKLNQFLNLAPVEFSNSENQKRFEESFLSKIKLKDELSFLEHSLSRLENSIVFCHNDLLLGNIIYNREKNSVTFIDFEYADYNYQAYDIANHFNEYAGVDTVDYKNFPSAEYQKQWIRIYLERFYSKSKKEETVVTDSSVKTLFESVQKFTLASHFLWGLWSLIQAEHSTISFDFIGYAFVRFNEYFDRKKKVFSC